LNKLPNSPIHNFLDQIFARYKTSSPLKNLDLSTITYDTHSKFLLKDFLLDNVEEDSANRNEMRRNPLHLKLKGENNNKLVNYEEDEEDLMGKGMERVFFYRFI